MPYPIGAYRVLNLYRIPYEEASLTFTGDLITDAVREAGEEGDGLTPPAGVGIWPAATNLVTQSVPGATAETGVTKAGDAAATLAIVQDTLMPFPGDPESPDYDVWELDNSEGEADATVDFAGNATAAAHTGSIWARALAGSPTVSIEGGGTPTAITATTAYARFSQSRTASAGDNLRITAPAGAVVRFVAGQLETGSIATPFIRTDGSTASRTAGRIQVPVSDLGITATQGAVFAALSPGWSNSNEPYGGTGEPTLFSWAADANNRLSLFYGEANNRWEARRVASGTSTSGTYPAAITHGTPTTICYAWEAERARLSANGASFINFAGANIPVLAATSADIGAQAVFGGLSRQIASNVLWFATFAGTLTDADAAALNALGDGPVTWRQVANALSYPDQLCAVWTCEDDTFWTVKS